MIARYLAISLILFAFACKDDNNNHNLDQLPEVVTLKVSDICPDSALGGGNIVFDGSTKITAKGVVWSRTESPSISEHDGITNDGEWAGEYWSQITGLQPDTKYFVRAYASNRHGLAYGDQVSFSTLEENTAADIEGNIYHTVIIGNQEWFAENLRVTQFSEGTPIAGDLSQNEWYSGMSPGYRIYPHENIEGIDSDEEMRSVYGLLYNGYAAGHARGLCPRAGGWRVAAYDDWNELTDFVQNQHPENIADRLKSCRQMNSPLGGQCSTDTHPRWDYHSEHHGTDDYGFSALPAGLLSWTGPFIDLGSTGSWWCYDMNPQSGHLYYVYLRNDQGLVGKHHSYRNNGFSVRCVRSVPMHR